MNKFLKRWANAMQTWGFLFRTIELVAIFIAIVAFFNELRYRDEERTARAWQLLTTSASGNSGKGEALEYLNSRGISLEGIELTPPVLTERWKQTPVFARELEDGCPQYTYLHKVELLEAPLAAATLACSDLEAADLRRANLRGADLRETFLTDTDMRGALPHRR